MEIISHRGYWIEPTEKNTATAFIRSFSKNYGTETDFRDFKGELVISHDMANEDCMLASTFFEIYKQHNCTGTLAINIKADGLQEPLLNLLKKHTITNYFVFDMSVPDLLHYDRKGFVYFSRRSEYELTISKYNDCHGIWLDAFNSVWFTAEEIEQFIQDNKKVAIVSCDLHHRDPKPLWSMLKAAGLHQNSGIILCTDIPEDASTFFEI